MQINETEEETVVLLSNSRSSRVVMVFFAPDVFGEVSIKSYLVNRPKYQWASAEGFSLDQMVELVDEKIFIEIDPSKVSSYLL